MQLFSEETFGPVAALFKFDKEEDAIAMANDTPYGLAGYFFTKDLRRAWRCAPCGSGCASSSRGWGSAASRSRS